MDRTSHPASRDHDPQPGAPYGFLGVGAITRAMVEGLSTGPDDAPEIHLSPRNATISADLAARFPNVRVGADNQDVVDHASTVVVAVRPPDAGSTLRSLRFAPHQALISVVAGVSIEDLEVLAAPVTRIARAIPLPSVAQRRGSIPVFPATDVARSLFDRIGQTLEVGSASVFDAFSASSATVATHLDQLATIAGWLESRGVPAPDANHYVASVFSDVAASYATGDPDFTALADEHATPGGLNEQIRTLHREHGSDEVMRGALDAVFTRISK